MTDVVGIQAARAALRADAGRARCLYLQRGRRDARVSELIVMAKDAGVRYQSVDAGWFKRRQPDAAHQGVVLDCAEIALASENGLKDRWASLPENPLLLVLDGVTDPRNLGACLRSANGAGVDVVILPKRNSAPVNDVVMKTAQGGVEEMFIVNATNLARILTWLKERNVWIVGADDGASTAWSNVDLTGATAIVLGSEGKGLRRLTKEHCDELVMIPMAGGVTNLNVSVATGIMLYEAVRQRLHP